MSENTLREVAESIVLLAYHCVPAGLSPGYPEILPRTLFKFDQLPKPNQPVRAPMGSSSRIAP